MRQPPQRLRKLGDVASASPEWARLVYWCSGALVYSRGMARLTITLSDDRHEKLRMRAARRHVSIASLIEDDLKAAEEARVQEIRMIIERGRRNAEAAPPLTEDELMELAVRLTHEVREEMASEREQLARNP